ncbi:hypothetical protein F2P81_006670 [Scophthalmus maximus]|uniref:Uncharacterized protein n=1 Tax=Scophthalmus maximus TaxID=52904 RepID=A0A6A4TF09_SCOMX|nr:hypothetical protein F2P81_006670 [Scophthalmus maximus]
MTGDLTSSAVERRDERHCSAFNPIDPLSDNRSGFPPCTPVCCPLAPVNTDVGGHRSVKRHERSDRSSKHRSQTLVDVLEPRDAEDERKDRVVSTYPVRNPCPTTAHELSIGPGDPVETLEHEPRAAGAQQAEQPTCSRFTGAQPSRSHPAEKCPYSGKRRHVGGHSSGPEANRSNPRYSMSGRDIPTDPRTSAELVNRHRRATDGRTAARPRRLLGSMQPNPGALEPRTHWSWTHWIRVFTGPGLTGSEDSLDLNSLEPRTDWTWTHWIRGLTGPGLTGSEDSLDLDSLDPRTHWIGGLTGPGLTGSEDSLDLDSLDPRTDWTWTHWIRELTGAGLTGSEDSLDLASLDPRTHWTWAHLIRGFTGSEDSLDLASLDQRIHWTWTHWIRGFTGSEDSLDPKI